MAELVLGVIATVDLCLTRGNQIIELYRAFRDAEQDINEKILLIENHWTKLRIQLEFLRGITNLFDQQHARIQQDLLLVLHTKLSTATSTLDVAATCSSGLRRIRYPFMRQSMEKLMAELDSWQKVFDPTWFLIIRISNPLIDSGIREWQTQTAVQAPHPPLSRAASSFDGSGSTVVANCSPVDALSKLRHIQLGADVADAQTANDLSINLDSSGLEDATDVPILYTTSRVIQRPRSTKLLVVETVPAPVIAGEVRTNPTFKLNVENLARKLKQLEPGTSGLLRCYGTVKRRSAQKRLLAIDMIFRTPDECQTTPCTLRQIMMERSSPSITQIVAIAKQVARAVSFFHACDFVHKSIRPENVLIFPPDPDSEPTNNLGLAFLVGYEQLRHAFFQTELRGDSAFQRNLYRHPQRQGIRAQERYIMQHDIYSLGVCLLEMGLWHSFVLYEKGQEQPELSAALGLEQPQDETELSHDTSIALANKDVLVQLAQSQLPQRLGDVYARVVLACLTCLDAGNQMFGDEASLEDEDGVLVGVRFIEQILMELDRIYV